MLQIPNKNLVTDKIQITGFWEQTGKRLFEQRERIEYAGDF
jgi:hypothetical protein